MFIHDRCGAIAIATATATAIDCHRYTTTAFCLGWLLIQTVAWPRCAFATSASAASGGLGRLATALSSHFPLPVHFCCCDRPVRRRAIKGCGSWGCSHDRPSAVITTIQCSTMPNAQPAPWTRGTHPPTTLGYTALRACSSPDQPSTHPCARPRRGSLGWTERLHGGRAMDPWNQTLSTASPSPRPTTCTSVSLARPSRRALSWAPSHPFPRPHGRRRRPLPTLTSP